MMKMKQLEDDLAVARSEASDLQDESTAELENNIASIDALNAKIRDNLNKEHAEAKRYEDEYIELTAQITDLRQQKQDLLQNANLPLPQLTVENGKLLYKNRQWDSMSGSDQLKAATAIVRCLNPDCGFVLLDKLEQMDLDTLREFGDWLTAEGLQAIATRVSTGDECSIIIEDGCVNSATDTAASVPPPPTWQNGVF